MRTDHGDAKPVPIDDADERPYWDAAGRGELALQRCARCLRFVHPPGIGCPWCGHDELDWQRLGGEVQGTIYSFIVVHRAFAPGFDREVPYVAALCDIDLAPGSHILANLVGTGGDGVAIGRGVEMVWERRDAGLVVPQWKLRSEEEGT